MKNIWAKILEIIKANKLATAAVIIILLLLGVTYFQHTRITHWKDRYQTEAKLKNALLDSVVYYQNRHKEWVAEKLTIQETIKNLEKINGQLTDFQKELLLRVKEIEKKNDIITAALIETRAGVDSLLHRGTTVVDTTNKTVNFADSSRIGNKVVQYNFTVSKVLPAFPNVKPTLFINSFSFPNKQFVEFHWRKDKKADYPIAFSVSNSNGYFKTVNIDSYAIPDIKYHGSKLSQWLDKNGKTVLYIGGGILVGGTGVYLLTK